MIASYQQSAVSTQTSRTEARVSAVTDSQPQPRPDQLAQHERNDGGGQAEGDLAEAGEEGVAAGEEGDAGPDGEQAEGAEQAAGQDGAGAAGEQERQHRQDGAGAEQRPRPVRHRG